MRKGAWLLIAVAVAVDLGSKWLAVTWLSGAPKTFPVLPVFSATLVYNPGISFGLFGANTTTQSWGLSGLGIVIIGIIVWMAIRANDHWEQTGYALIIGGAIGNVLDRLHDGFVTDFLDFHVNDWRWPTFNFADVSITCGVALFIASAFRKGTGQERASTE